MKKSPQDPFAVLDADLDALFRRMYPHRYESSRNPLTPLPKSSLEAIVGENVVSLDRWRQHKIEGDHNDDRSCPGGEDIFAELRRLRRSPSSEAKPRK